METQSTAKTETPAQLFVRAMETGQRYVNAVQPDQWSWQSPCTEWSVRDVVNHIVYETLWVAELFAGKTLEEVGNRFDGDLVGDDPAGAYNRAVALARPAVEAPGAMEATVHLSSGPTPGAEYARQVFMDTLIHSWDIAKGSAQDTRRDPELVAACLPIAEELSTLWRSYGVLGPAIEVPPDADPQTRLLAMLGRRG